LYPLAFTHYTIFFEFGIAEELLKNIDFFSLISYILHVQQSEIKNPPVLNAPCGGVSDIRGTDRPSLTKGKAKTVCGGMIADAIEKRSFEIITSELETSFADAFKRFDKALLPVLLRMIHTTADFSWIETLRVSEGALAGATQALRAGATIVTDTKMAEAGIDKKRLSAFCGKVVSFMADADVAENAKLNGTTRAAASMEKAAALCQESGAPFIFAIGNAPTALMRLCALHSETCAFKPSLVIGMPVGFVNVIESKEMLLASGLPCISAPGRKGGSAVAAAVCNALLRIAACE
jgi:precorrin-8X/cobalt-precorrin-8 methylmutase